MRIRIAVAAAAITIAGALTAGAASAMPIGGLATTADTAVATVDNVAWTCGPYRCFWHPGPNYWGPRPFRFGWYHPHRRWW